MRPWIERSDRERFVVLLLSTRHTVNTLHEVGVGAGLGAGASAGGFVAALLANAAAVVLAHNSPVAAR